MPFHTMFLTSQTDTMPQHAPPPMPREESDYVTPGSGAPAPAPPSPTQRTLEQRISPRDGNVPICNFYLILLN